MPASKIINHGGVQQGQAPRKQKQQKPKPEQRHTGSVPIAVQPVSIPQNLIRYPRVARLAKRPQPKGPNDDVDGYVTIQSTHNLLTNRHRKEGGDKVLLNNPITCQSEDLENAVTEGTDFAAKKGSVINLLWNVPCPHTEPKAPPPSKVGDPATVTVFDTRGNLVKLRQMGFTIKNTYTTPIWVHANTPICKTDNREVVVGRLCGFYFRKSRVESVYLEPGQSTRYTMPMAALQPGQAFSEFIETGANGSQLAKGRTMMIAQLLVERPTDAESNQLLQGGVAASMKPYVSYDYTDLEMEFKKVQDGLVTHVEPFALTYSQDLDDLYGITSIALTQETVALKKRLHGQVVTLQHCEENHLRMIDENTGKLVEVEADGVQCTVPALGVIKDGILECQFKGDRGYLYLWDVKLDQPLECEALVKRPTATIGEEVKFTYAIETAGVYSMNWGLFLENLGAAAWEVAKEFIV